MRNWFYWPGTAIIGFVARLLWGARVEGSEHIPSEGPFILVGNHSSNLDPLILGWAVGNRSGRMIHFMAKAEMLRWPVLGWLATQSAVFFVRRGEGDRSAQRFALEALAAGRPIALHPEGTRSRDGHLKAGKSGAAFLAMRSGAPLLPAGIAGTHEDLPGRLEGSAREPHLHSRRRAVHAPARSGRPDRPGDPRGRHGTDHERDREAVASGRSEGLADPAYIRTRPRTPLEWTR